MNPISNPPTSSAAPVSLRSELVAGVTLSVIALPSSMAAGVVAYQALGPEMAAAGSIAGLAGAVFAGLVGALARTPSPVPTTPGVMVALLQANFATTMLATTGNLNATIAAMAICVALAGLWQVLFGLAGLGNVVRYVPHPVLAGFGLGVSLLLFIGQMPMLFGRTSFGALVTTPFGASELAMPLIGLVLIAGMLLLVRRFPRLPVPLIGLFAAIVFYHGLHLVFPGIALGRTASGDTLGELAGIVGAALGSFATLPREMIQPIILNSVAVAAIGIFDTLLTVRASKGYIETDATPRRELAGLGLANMAASVSGAAAMTTSLSVAVPAYLAGGRTTLTRIVGCFALLAIALIPGFIGSMPLLGLTALTLFFVVRSINWSVIDMVRDAIRPQYPSLRGRAWRDLSILLAVMLGILLVHPTMGVLIGVVLSCLLFITDMARPMIVARTTGATLLSRRGRSAHDMDLLRQKGERTLVLRLQGVLFFGNCDDLDTELRRLEPEFDTAILDMRRVTDIDATGNKLLNDMRARLAKNGRNLCIAGLTPELALFIGLAIETLPDLDAALERFEEKSLGEHLNAPHAQDDLEFLQSLSIDRRKIFTAAVEHRAYAPGDILCRMGDAGDGMWIILSGSIRVRIPATSGALRVAGIAAGAPAGELALLEGNPRSADLLADGSLQTLYLSKSAFETLSDEAPDIGQAIITWIAIITAQRLRSSSEALRFAASE